MEGGSKPPSVHGKFQRVKTQKLNAYAKQSIYMQEKRSRKVRLGIMMKINPYSACC